MSDFKDLLRAFDPLIMGEKRFIDDLYDIWKKGAPTPNSIILDPKTYNPEKDTTVVRIIPTLWLQPYLKELADRRGIPLTHQEIKETLEGTLF